MSVISRGLAHLSTARTLLIWGLRALPVFAREGMGAILKAGWPPLTPWPEGKSREQGGHDRMDSCWQYSGSPGPAWDSVFCHPRARAPVGRDVAWLLWIRVGSYQGAHASNQPRCLAN